MKNLPKELFKLLSLHTPSGQEGPVINYIKPRLKKLLDTVWQDSYGNLLGEVKMGSDPYTILLSAHMDTVAYVQPKPSWKVGRIIYNTAGSALGGDDKCGIAVILAVLRNLHKTEFTGTVKVIFSREEEIGCVGASMAVKINPKWFDDIQGSVVIDRRGSDNIITGSWSENFCSPEYGEFWEDMAGKLGFEGKVQEGTISDTMVFSELGINGVNLSAGYYNAHTKDEFIKVDEVIRTAKWVLTALDHIQEQSFPEFSYLMEDYKSYRNYYTGKKEVIEEDVLYQDQCDYCWGDFWEDELYLTNSNHHLCESCLTEAAGLSTTDAITLTEYYKQKYTYTIV